MADKYAHGRTSKLTIGGTTPTTLCITKFEFTENWTEHDISSTCGNGYTEFQTGMRQVSFSGEAKLDLTVDPFTTMSTGDDIAVDWYADGSGTTPVAYLHIPKARCSEVKISSPVNDIISYTFSGKSNGSYTIS